MQKCDKCEKCREREATVFITRVVDKQSTQSRMCEQCAREQAIADAWLSGAPIPPDALEMPLEELLTELLTGAPDPDSFAPDEDKWSLQKLAAYDLLHSRGEFSGDEDLADEADEMDDEADGPIDGPIDGDIDPTDLSAEEIQAALDEMEPGEREAVSQMLEALDEVQEHLESIMLQHAQEIGDLDSESQAGEAGEAGPDDTLASLQSLFASELMRPIEATPVESQAQTEEHADLDPFADDEDGVGSDLLADDLDDSDPFVDEDTASDGDGGPSLNFPPDLLGMNPFGSPIPRSEGAPEFKSAPSERCPKCRTTWDRLREDGRAGCSSCYEMFEEMLGETMEMGQHEAQHIGKSPRAAGKRHKRLQMLRSRRDSRLQMLRDRLQSALDAEQFEEAAKLRDKIKVVESTIVDETA